MLDSDLGRLAERDEHVSLQGLERDIWEREARHKSAAAASRRLARWQGIVLSVAVLSSAMAGAAVAARTAPPLAADWFASPGQSAPATLLFGYSP